MPAPEATPGMIWAMPLAPALELRLPLITSGAKPPLSHLICSTNSSGLGWPAAKAAARAREAQSPVGAGAAAGAAVEAVDGAAPGAGPLTGERGGVTDGARV